MLLDAETLARIERGEVTLVFRRWRRPTVKTGGTLMTAAGQLDIASVRAVEPAEITEGDARQAGHASTDILLAELERWGAGGQLYRIELGGLRADPRIALREQPPDEEGIAALSRRLARLDAASPEGAWTESTLLAIRDHPGLRAGDLCRLVGQERDRFKPNVRKLKGLGLTVSLEVGYRLSPRGEAYLLATEGRVKEPPAP